MNVSLILGHPNPESFNHALAAVAANVLEERGHTVWYHDLCAERFNPALTIGEIRSRTPASDIRAYCDELVRSDALVIVHPNWWGQPPAVLKGWVDRVLRPGVAYRFVEGGNSGQGVPEGLLRARFAAVINTSDTEEERENTVFGDPLQTLWQNCVLGFCGVERLHRRVLRVVVTSTPERRAQWLNETADWMRELF